MRWPLASAAWIVMLQPACAPSVPAVAVPVSDAAVTTAATLPSLGSRPAPDQPSPSAEPRSSPAESPAESTAEPSARTPQGAPDIGDLFAPPKVVVPPPSPKPEVASEPAPPVQEEPPPLDVTPPALRLVGFVDAEGLQALLSVDGRLNAVRVGESVQGVELVAMDPPLILLSHGGREFPMDLLAQPWLTRPADMPNPMASGDRPVTKRAPPSGATPRSGMPATPALPPRPRPTDPPRLPSPSPPAIPAVARPALPGPAVNRNQPQALPALPATPPSATGP